MNNIPRTLGKMTTSVNRSFRKIADNYYEEVWMHFITFLNEDGSIKGQKLDKQVFGFIWKLARPGERSSWGECVAELPEFEKPIRLVCTGKKRTG